MFQGKYKKKNPKAMNLSFQREKKIIRKACLALTLLLHSKISVPWEIKKEIHSMNKLGSHVLKLLDDSSEYVYLISGLNKGS